MMKHMVLYTRRCKRRDTLRRPRRSTPTRDGHWAVSAKKSQKVRYYSTHPQLISGSSAKKTHHAVSLKPNSRKDCLIFSSLPAVVSTLAHLHLKCTSWRSNDGRSWRLTTSSILARLHKNESNSDVLMYKLPKSKPKTVCHAAGPAGASARTVAASAAPSPSPLCHSAGIVQGSEACSMHEGSQLPSVPPSRPAGPISSFSVSTYSTPHAAVRHPQGGQEERAGRHRARTGEVS